MEVAIGILTSQGGATSHAAVVTRGMGKTCVAGAGEIVVDERARQMRARGQVFKEGDWITLDGTAGSVLRGKRKLLPPDPENLAKLYKFMSWAEPFRKIGVRANADIPRDAEKAREFGAEGIGLCRTEHMFFAPDRIPHMRAMILANNEKDRRKALKKLLPYQRKDFEGLFKAMQGLRGCRLGITYPEITEMQAQAIIEAAVAVEKKGIETHAEVMIPLIATVKEMENQGAIVRRVAEEVCKEKGKRVHYHVGTMIELPRACLVADEIAKEAEFFSFGTNDLTQTAFGFSRDDVNKILTAYLQEGILKQDPFAAIDQVGVGELVKIGIERGRKTRPDLEIGICGEHGGEPESVKFCHQVGMDYVSCSPFRVLTARLAAAQAGASDTLKVEGGRTK